MKRKILTLPRPLEKEPHNKNLQPRHAHHDDILNNAEPENPLFRRPHSAEVAVLPRSEVLLVALDGAELAGQFVDAFGQEGGLFGRCALPAGEGGTRFVFDLFVGKAEGLISLFYVWVWVVG